MDTTRYIFALLNLIALPPALLLWFLIHPFARFWRRLGPVASYAVVSVPALACMAWLFVERERLLSTEYGTSYPLVVLGVLCACVAGIVTYKRNKQLTFSILAGWPELTHDQKPGKLLTEGLYAKIRNPRYVEMGLWVLAYAMFTNYLAMYVLFLLYLPSVYLIVLLEERELRCRFGSEYEDHCKEVPRFWPWGRRALDRSQPPPRVSTRGDGSD